MDEFDKYLFDEISGQYAKKSLTQEEYEEVFNRFSNIDYLDEVKPYLLAMRFFGWGTTSEKETVLAELADALSGEDYVLKGLYYDLLLSEKSDDPQVRINLHQMVQKGYTNIYTKDRTNIDKAVSAGDVDSEDTVPCETVCAVCRARIKFDRKPQRTELSACPYCGGWLQFSQKETEALDEPYKAVENSDDETEPTIYETECTCGYLIELDRQTLESGTVTCPACGEILIFTMEDEESEELDQNDDPSVVYEAECACGTLIEFDQQTLEAGEVICPTCGDVLEIYLE